MLAGGSGRQSPWHTEGGNHNDEGNDEDQTRIRPECKSDVAGACVEPPGLGRGDRLRAPMPRGSRVRPSRRGKEASVRMLRFIIPSLLLLAAFAAALPAIAGIQENTKVPLASNGLTPSAPPVTHSAAARGWIVWKADGERPLHQEWAEYSTANHCAVTSDVVRSDPEVFRESSVVAQGSYAYEFVASKRDADSCYGGERTELGQGLPERANFSDARRFNQGDDRWISFQFRLGRGFPVDNPNWDLIAQWKQNPSTTVVPGPMFALQVYSGSLWLSAAGGTADPNPWDNKIWRLAHVTIGWWIKVSMHIEFDTNPTVGFVEVYGDPDGKGMRRLLPLRRLSTLATDARGNWVPSNSRIGIYRNAVIPGTAHLYYDGYTVATTRSAAEANAFRPSAHRGACGASGRCRRRS